MLFTFKTSLHSVWKNKYNLSVLYKIWYYKLQFGTEYIIETGPRLRSDNWQIDQSQLPRQCRCRQCRESFLSWASSMSFSQSSRSRRHPPETTTPWTLVLGAKDRWWGRRWWRPVVRVLVRFDSSCVVRDVTWLAKSKRVGCRCWLQILPHAFFSLFNLNIYRWDGEDLSYKFTNWFERWSNELKTRV